jgi:integrase
MFEHAKRGGLLESDPTAEAIIPKERQPAQKPGEKRHVLPKFLEKDELKAFLQFCRFVLTTNMWALFVGLGLRRP